MFQAWAQSRATALMQASGTLRRTPLVSDGRGGKLLGTPTNTTIAVNIRSQASTATEQAVADRLAGRAVYFLDIPVGTAATNADQIIVGSRTFEIQEVIQETLAAMDTCVCVEE